MANEEEQPTRERHETDLSLLAERRKTDDEMSRTLGAAEERAHEVIGRAREQAAETLGAARAKAKAKLESAGASVEALAFIAVASHELKTPLTPLALRLHSLAREAAAQPQSPFAHHVNGYVDTAKRQLKRLSVLMADLLDVSRIASGQLTLELEAVDLGAIVHDVVSRYRRQAEQAGSVVEVEAPGVIGQWDELLLEQALTSLLENAIKYGRGRPIRVRLEAVCGNARLTIRDEGIGIARENLSRIFGRFERAVSERNYGGLGLGLYICRTIIEAMGGSIAVESEPGQGSTFTVELPLPGPGAIVVDSRAPRPH